MSGIAVPSLSDWDVEHLWRLFLWEVYIFFNAFIRRGCTAEDYSMVGALCVWVGCLYTFAHLTYASGSTVLGFVVGGYSATIIIYITFFVVVKVELLSLQSAFLFVLCSAVHVLSHYFAWVYAIPGNSMPIDAYIGGAFLFSLFMLPASGFLLLATFRFIEDNYTESAFVYIGYALSEILVIGAITSATLAFAPANVTTALDHLVLARPAIFADLLLVLAVVVVTAWARNSFRFRFGLSFSLVSLYWPLALVLQFTGYRQARTRVSQ